MTEVLLLGGIKIMPSAYLPKGLKAMAGGDAFVVNKFDFRKLCACDSEFEAIPVFLGVATIVDAFGNPVAIEMCLPRKPILCVLGVSLPDDVLKGDRP
jgi:hypothetical protein